MGISARHCRCPGEICPDQGSTYVNAGDDVLARYWAPPRAENSPFRHMLSLDRPYSWKYVAASQQYILLTFSLLNFIKHAIISGEEVPALRIMTRAL